MLAYVVSVLKPYDIFQVVEVNPKSHKIKLHNGKEIGYDKLLLATGLSSYTTIKRRHKIKI